MDELRPVSESVLRRIIDQRGVCVTVYAESGPRATLDEAIHEASLLLRGEGDDSAHTAVLEQLRGVFAAVRTPVPAGAAIFATATDVWSVSLQAEPAVGVAARVRSADRFFVVPLLADLGARIPVMVLALSQNSVRLVDAGAAPPRIVPVPGLPQSLHGFDALDLTNDRQTLAHLRTSEEPTIRERQYVRTIDDAIGGVIGPDALLVVAAAEPLTGLFAELSRHKRLARPGISGNVDDQTPDELALAAMTAMAQERASVRRGDVARLTEFPERELVTGDPAVVLAAGGLGAIDTLFVDLERSDEAGYVEEAARAAHACGARVIAASASELPGHGAAAAILRYPVDANPTEVG
jgi:hypothetical protein